MSSDASLPTPPPDNGEPAPAATADPGLPTVTPPSGKMLMRLFLVPFVIVCGLVVLLILGESLLGWVARYLPFGSLSASRSPEHILRDLDNSNPEVRWRGANDLAQVLPRDDHVASDAGFALELADRLDTRLTASDEEEKLFAQRQTNLSSEEVLRERKKLEENRHYVMFLASCLGKFMVPVGVPLLEKLATQESGMEANVLAERRRQALLALAVLGDNLRRFDALPAERQQEVLQQLEADGERSSHSGWARRAAEAIEHRRKGRPDLMGMDRVLEQCADSDDPMLRELAAFAANFWYGSAAEDARLEAMLGRLANDSGKGEEQMAREVEGKPEAGPTRSVTKRPGYRVQVNATVALARRGSPKVPLNLLKEMLNPQRLRALFVLQDRQGGGEQPDEEMVSETLVNTLKAVRELHQKRPEMDLSILRPLVDALAQDANKTVQLEARQTQTALDSTK
jgi:hypothetical protein